MTIEFDCDSGDYSSAENLISRFLVTTTQGIAAADLKRAEIAQVNHMFSLHVHGHPSHTWSGKFRIPEGYENREGIIYKKE
jgi:hypothetical protein